MRTLASLPLLLQVFKGEEVRALSCVRPKAEHLTAFPPGGLFRALCAHIARERALAPGTYPQGLLVRAARARYIGSISVLRNNYMHVYFNGVLLHAAPNSFIDKDGKTVSYFVNTLAHAGGVITINSQKDWSSFKDIPSTISLTLRLAEGGKQYKVSLFDITPRDVDSDGSDKTIV